MKNYNIMKRLIAVLMLISSFMLTLCSTQTSTDASKTEQEDKTNASTKDMQNTDYKHSNEYKYLTIDFLMGKIRYASDTLFTVIPDRYSNQSGRYLQKKVLDAFIKMHEAAKEDGISLTIISASRDFYQQKRIWENKWDGTVKVGGNDLAKTVKDTIERASIILKYSSMPGTSRHHWGTDIDINSLSPAYFAQGKGIKEYEWLRNNARKFGFCQVYSEIDKINRHSGYQEEKWHWSYMPLSDIYLKEYLRIVSYSHITGFKGSGTAKNLNVIRYYVEAINRKCLPEENE